jgi:spore germination protein GerM
LTRKHVTIAAIVAVLMIAGVVYATFWLLEQPVPQTTAAQTQAAGEAERVAIESTDDAAEPESAGGTIAIKLYVLASSGQSLETDDQEIALGASVQQQAKEVVTLLVQRSASFPDGVALREVFITSQGVAYVDFSNELVQNHPGGSSAEELTVYGLSNTLIANFPSIKMVKILVEGREIPSLAGHLDLTLSYGRAPEYLRPASELSEARPESNETS